MPYKAKKPKHKTQKEGGQRPSLPSTKIDEAFQSLKLETSVPVAKASTSETMRTLTAANIDTASSIFIPSARTIGPKRKGRRSRLARTIEACHTACVGKPKRTPEDIAAKDKGWQYYDIYKLCGKEVADEWEEYGRRQEENDAQLSHPCPQSPELPRCEAPVEDQSRDQACAHTTFPDLDELFGKTVARWADDDDDELSGVPEPATRPFIELDY